MSDKLTEEEEKDLVEAWYDIAKKRVKAFNSMDEFLRDLKKNENW